MCGAQLRYDYVFDSYEVTKQEESVKNYSASGTECDYSKHSSGIPSQTPSLHKTTLETTHIAQETRYAEKILRKKRMKAFFFTHKKIRIARGCMDLLGEDIESVKNFLYNQAFNNIKAIPISDIYVGSTCPIGKVEQIVVAGSSYFEEGDQFPYDVEIIVTYHIKRIITIPFSEKELRKTNYIAAGDKLQKLGFTEIYERPIRDLVTGWITKDGSVEKVTIGDVYPFKKNSSFYYDTRIVIEYHTFQKK